MHKLSANKDMEKKITMIKGERRGSREGGSVFMSNTNYQRIEN